VHRWRGATKCAGVSCKRVLTVAHRLPPISSAPAAYLPTASPPPTNRLPTTRPSPRHRLATPCAPSARWHQPTSCQPPAHYYVARRPSTASPSPSHPTSAKKVMYDPQSFCVYVLNAGGLWLSRDAPYRFMCDPQGFCIYVLSADGFWQCRDARHRLMCDKLSSLALERCETTKTHPPLSRRWKVSSHLVSKRMHAT